MSDAEKYLNRDEVIIWQDPVGDGNEDWIVEVPIDARHARYPRFVTISEAIHYAKALVTTQKVNYIRFVEPETGVTVPVVDDSDFVALILKFS